MRKSLTLLVPPHRTIEQFLTRLRNELIILAAKNEEIPESLKLLAETLAIQCFLNEYVYAQTPEEDALQSKLSKIKVDHDSFIRYLPIVACYKPIYQLDIDQDWLEGYPTNTYESEMLLKSQLWEPKEEEKIKTLIKSNSQVTDLISMKVQQMYEENPYPRYRHADYTDKSLAIKISKVIELESTKNSLHFLEEFNASNSSLKVLIAGCGTGNQVINASRYKNVEITAIDLSGSSIAYAMRKAKEKGMKNIDFKQIDLLNLASLNEKFDIIECGGVLHHMKSPARGLAVLNNQLKPGGYIKLGLYSDIGRKILKSREIK